MPKRVSNKVVGNKLVDGSLEIEDVTSVEIPDVEFTTDEYNVPGLAAAIEAIDPSHVNTMTFAVNHNNGINCHTLAEPRKHEFEFRIAQQALNTAMGNVEYNSIKYRVKGFPKKVTDGTIEQGNPIGGKVEYTVIRFEKEIAGQVVFLVDALAGIIKINNVDYTNQIMQLLN